MPYVIKHKNGTYFHKWGAKRFFLGPNFGATLKGALRYNLKRNAEYDRTMHYGFALTKIVKVKS